MSAAQLDRPIEILLAEDSPGDARLTQEALRQARVANNLSIMRNGEEALAFLRREAAHADAPRPDLILLDLNMPKLDGRELLAILKADAELCHIPVIILTTSNAPQDTMQAYKLHANSFVTKPVDVEEFFSIMRTIEAFWMETARLPCA